MINHCDLLLIKAENISPKCVLIIDDHKLHLKSHIFYFYKKGMIKHIFQHLHLWYVQKKLNLPIISLTDVLNSIRGRNRNE